MLLLLKREPFIDDRYLWFYKYNGVRGGVSSLDNKREIFGRGVSGLTESFPEVNGMYLPKNSLVDSELIVLDENMKDQFSLIQNRIGVKGNKAKIWAETRPATFIPFDILIFKGKDIRKFPLKERLNILSNEMAFTPKSHLDSNELFERAKKQGMEGIVGKQRESIYSNGTRDERWIKVRVRTKKTCNIVGFRVESNYLASFAITDEFGSYVGKVGTGGLNDDTRKSIYSLIPSFPDGKKYNKEDIIWKKVELKIIVEYSDVSKSGMLLHPSIVQE
jgi:ATP-dependent DNA ligase